MDISPIKRIQNSVLDRKGVGLSIKRDDLLGGPAQGNKHRKISGWIDLARRQHCDMLVSFGGAFSNHLYALAWIARQHGLKAIGYVRGEHDADNPTLQSCSRWGMQLIYLSRKEYSRKKNLRNLTDHPGALVIPEGGAGQPGQLGAVMLGAEILNQCNRTHWACAAGTGTTALGLHKALHDSDDGPRLLVFDVLKRATPKTLHHPSIEVIASHFGGFAKSSPELVAFIRQFHSDTGIYLDPIYTGKMMLRLFQLIESDHLPRGSDVLAIHTGGHQGIKAFNYRFGPDLPTPDWLKQLDENDV